MWYYFIIPYTRLSLLVPPSAQLVATCVGSVSLTEVAKCAKNEPGSILWPDPEYQLGRRHVCGHKVAGGSGWKATWQKIYATALSPWTRRFCRVISTVKLWRDETGWR